jgi:transposase
MLKDLRSSPEVEMMRFVGGELQGEFMKRLRGVDPGRCLVIPIDVGKTVAMSLVADHYGEVIIDPFEFDLTESGVAGLIEAIAMAEGARSAVVVRVGVEAAGHYHRTVVTRLRSSGLEVVELNPGAVKQARSQQLLRALKSDARDLEAMVELLIRGAGRPPEQRDQALVAQVAWTAHRRRKVKARSAVTNQVLSQLDLVFPGLQDCFKGVLTAKAGRVIVRDIVDPARIRRLGAEGLRRFVQRRDVQMSRPKAAAVTAAARNALFLSEEELAARRAVLAADIVLLDCLDAMIDEADQQLSAVLADTPAAILTTLPGISTVRASNYGAEIGDPWRFRNADAAYRFSGLVPASYESAKRSRPGQHISREGSVELREAIIELWEGLSRFDPEFASYKRRLVNEGKKRSIATVAVGRRAHRLAFAMLRSQRPYDEGRWATSVATGRSVMAQAPGGVHQNDVTCLSPTNTLYDSGAIHKRTALG